MRKGSFRNLLAGALALAFTSPAARAEPPSAFHTDPVGQAIERGLNNTRSFMAGPQYVVPEVDPGLSCEQIYEEMVRLMPQSYSYKPAYWDDPRNAAIGAMGFVFTPTFYLWGYTAFDHYSEDQRVRQVNMRVDALRRASARRDCWVR